MIKIFKKENSILSEIWQLQYKCLCHHFINISSYAVIKKETPPKAAVRRKRSTKSLGDKQFATLPLMPRRSDHELAPPRPPRNYSTIAHEKHIKPDKPPRRKSASSLVEISK